MSGIIYEPKGRAREYAHLAINHYKGCAHGCTYCYVPHRWISRKEFHAKVEPRPDVVARVDKDATSLAVTDKRVLLSFASDPYPEIDRRLQLTRAVLDILRDDNIPFTVLTKAGLLPIRDFDLYRAGIDAFAVTLTTLDADTASSIEPGAAPPAERIDGLIAAKQRGIETWVSLEPVIEPMESLKIITMTHEWVDLYKIGKLNHVKSKVTPGEWRDFAQRAVNLCIAYGVKYYIKQDLAAHLGEFPFGNTDNRTISRAHAESAKIAGDR